MAESLPFTFFSVSLLLFLSHPLLVSSQEFIFNGFKQQFGSSPTSPSSLSLEEDAEIENNGLLQLTNTSKKEIGRAFYRSPLTFKNSADKVFSFSTSFVFAIVPRYPNYGGHGLAFIISPSQNFSKPFSNQYFGLLNPNNNGDFSNHLLAVEFDTVQDFEFKDINENHVGIDLNSLHSNISANATEHGINLKSGNKFQAWVDYDSVVNQLNVTISPLSSAKPSVPILSLDVDLSPILLNSMYVGFSAATGQLASHHYILGWSFKMNGIAPSLEISSLPSLPGSKKKNRAVLEIWVPVTVLFIAIIGICLTVYFINKVRNRDVIEDWEMNVGPHRYSYKELKIATRGFREKELVGYGGFGRVYKGILPNSKTPVAVKRISHESKQGLREFTSEIASIGRLRHRNLVQLHGWCRRRDDLLLVYEFMPNGSLDKLLFDQTKPNVLSWEQRFNIIKGIASALLYLHEEWEQIVIHRDVKASNVLLDSDLNGRLGDFGMAKTYEHGANPTTTRVVGTLGYLAPELTRTGKASTCSDVFAFGALVLEITCGRKPVEPKALPEELILVDWVWDRWKEGKVFECVDPRMNDYDEEEVVMVVKLGLMCSNNAPVARPSMRQVVSWLEGEVKAPDVLSAPSADDNKGKNEGEIDDFVHSYPSSDVEKVSEFTAIEVGDGSGESAVASS